MPNQVFDFFLDFFSSSLSTSCDSFSSDDFGDTSFISVDDDFGEDFFFDFFSDFLIAFNPNADFVVNSSDGAFGDTVGDTFVVSGDDFVSTPVFDFSFDFFAEFFGAGFSSSSEFSFTISCGEEDFFSAGKVLELFIDAFFDLFFDFLGSGFSAGSWCSDDVFGDTDISDCVGDVILTSSSVAPDNLSVKSASSLATCDQESTNCVRSGLLLEMVKYLILV